MQACCARRGRGTMRPNKRNVAGAGTACSCFAPATFVLLRHTSEQHSLNFEADFRWIPSGHRISHPTLGRLTLFTRRPRPTLVDRASQTPTIYWSGELRNGSISPQKKFDQSGQPASCRSPQPKRLSNPDVPISFALARRCATISAADPRWRAKSCATTPVATAEA